MTQLGFVGEVGGWEGQGRAGSVFPLAESQLMIMLTHCWCCSGMRNTAGHQYSRLII